MNIKLWQFLCAAGLVSTFSVYSAQTDITVNASIDPTISVTAADGSPVPASLAMGYKAGTGLTDAKTSIVVWDNADKDISVKLVSAAQLSDGGSNTIPLSVSLNGNALSTTSSTLQFQNIFPSGVRTSGSTPLSLVISQTTKPGSLVAGTYSGVVSIVFTQATTKNGS